MKLPHFARLPGIFACGLVFLVWQGCGDNTREKRGGLEYIDAGAAPDAGDKSDRGSSASKDASDDNAEHVGSGGAAGSAGASGATAGSGGSAGRGASGSGGRGAAGKGGAASAGKGGAGGKGGAPAAGAGAGAVTGTAGRGGAAGHAAGAGASGTTSEAGAGGASGSAGEAGSGGAAGGGGQATDVGCGTRAGVTCGDARFCNFPPDAQCGEFDAPGVCEDVPGACGAVWAPVCGCDNATHANACVTHRDGISVRHDGLCTREECLHAGGRPVLSDGASTPTCDVAEQVWSIESGGDESAVCCLPGQTTGRTCGGIASLECDPRQFCNYETDAGGQGCDGMIADAGGVCQAIPTGCTLEYRPVCGCDKKTYSNACDAHSNGVSVLHDGACTELDCAAVAGRVVYSSGPQPMCAPGEAQWTTIVDSSGAMPIESSICCRQE